MGLRLPQPEAPAPHPADRAALALILVLCVVAGLLFPDFGMTWDESVEHYDRMKGPRTFDFWFGSRSPDQAMFDTGHNPFTFFVYYSLWLGLEAVGLDVDRAEAYHLFTALIAVAGVYFAYRIARTLLPPWWALGAAALLALTPRVVGHAFGNFKDTPFLVMWLACLATLIPAARDPSWRRLLLHGVAFAGLLIVRIGGLMFVPVSGLGLLLGGLAAPEPRWRDRVLRGAAALVLAMVLHTLSYPYLLLNPIDGIVELFETQREFVWHGRTLTLGLALSVENLPMWYAPLWLLVTTPEVTLIGLGAGAALWLTHRRLTIPGVLVAASALVPLVYVSLARAPIYDGIRHILFVVGPLTILAAAGLHALHQRLPARWPVPAGLAAAGLALTWQLWVLHPYPMVYFNQFAGGPRGAEGGFTLDYWGSSAREAAAWLEARSERTGLCILVDMERHFEHYLPGWAVDEATTLADCDPSSRYAYVFSRNALLTDAETYAASRPAEWVPVHRIRRAGATLGTIFENPAPVQLR